jgi:hypothetical protein
MKAGSEKQPNSNSFTGTSMEIVNAERISSKARN